MSFHFRQRDDQIRLSNASRKEEALQLARAPAVRRPDDFFVVEIAERQLQRIERIGDARLDNQKFKAAFRAKATMLDASEVEAETGHPVGGVSPLGLPRPLRVYLDVSLQAFDEVLPAAGATNAAVRIAPERLAALTGATWVDVTRPPDEG